VKVEQGRAHPDANGAGPERADAAALDANPDSTRETASTPRTDLPPAPWARAKSRTPEVNSRPPLDDSTESSAPDAVRTDDGQPSIAEVPKQENNAVASARRPTLGLPPGGRQENTQKNTPEHRPVAQPGAGVKTGDARSGRFEPAAPPKSKPQPAPKKPPAPPAPLHEKLLKALERDGRLSFSKAEGARLGSEAWASDAARASCLAALEEDHCLEKTFGLMVSTLGLQDNKLRFLLQDFAREALKRSRFFPEVVFKQIDDSARGQLDVEQLRRMMASADPAFFLKRGLDEKSISSEKIERWQRHATRCAMLLIQPRDPMPLAKLVEWLLQPSLPRANEAPPPDFREIPRLLDDRGQAVNTVYRVLKDSESLALQQASAAAQRAAQMETLLANRSEELASLKLEMQEALARVEHVAASARAESAERITALENESAQLWREIEQTSGQVVATLRRAMPLLEDGLVALRLPSPETVVTDDHIERAIEHLKALEAKLRGNRE